MENNAVFAPMPTASVSTATAVKPGDLVRERRANLSSLNIVSVCHVIRDKGKGWLLGAERGDGVDARRAAGGQPAGDQADEQQDRRDDRENERHVDRGCGAGQEFIEEKNESDRANDAEAGAVGDEAEARAQNEPDDIARLRPERHADADFRRALDDEPGDNG